MHKKIVSIGILAVMIFMFAGCGNMYNAIVIEDGFVFIQEFLDENRISALYYNIDYDETDEDSKMYIDDRTSPRNRTFIIKDQEALDAIFSEFPQTDFETEMVLLYMFPYPSTHDPKLKSIKLDTTLQIEFDMKNKGYLITGQRPYRHILIIKMDILDFTEVEFKRL